MLRKTKDNRKQTYKKGENEKMIEVCEQMVQ